MYTRNCAEHTVFLHTLFLLNRDVMAIAVASLFVLAIIMKDFAKTFYKSKAWKQCRAAYAQSVGGLCEECLQSGRYIPGEIVHHKIELTPDNIDRPEITLDWNNLELLCRECHAEMHGARQTRYKVDEYGRVSVR